MWAARAGHAEACADLLTAGADVNAITDFGESAAHYAAEAGHAEALAVLTAAGADLALQRKVDGATAEALHRGQVMRELRMMRLEEERGAARAGAGAGAAGAERRRRAGLQAPASAKGWVAHKSSFRRHPVFVAPGSAAREQTHGGGGAESEPAQP
mmetsp:Transcript_24903/g.81547  ORF Transcript_24903/g.81547 Transcript_24903/m.81547 type:complete len:156 (-) Transcript_24903:2970-3437(-)